MTSRESAVSRPVTVFLGSAQSSGNSRGACGAPLLTGSATAHLADDCSLISLQERRLTVPSR